MKPLRKSLLALLCLLAVLISSCTQTPQPILVTEQPASRAIGLSAEYFSSSDLTGVRSSQIDRYIQFDWGSASPSRNVLADSFSAKWQGFVKPSVSADYSFYLSVEGRASLSINNQIIKTGDTVSLKANTYYPVALSFQKTSQEASLKLEWSAEGLEKELVPQSVLYPVAGFSAQAVMTGTNLLLNSDFEAGTGNWIKYGAAEGTLTTSTGRASATALSTSAWAWIQQDLAASAIEIGQSYSFKGYAKASSTASCTFGFQGGGPAGESFSEKITFTSGLWTELGKIVTIPEGITWIAVFLSPTAQECQFDDLSLIAGDTTAPPPPVATDEALLNGGFEEGLNNWQVFGGLATATAQAKTGAQALEASSFSWVQQDFPVANLPIGDTFVFSASVKTTEVCTVGLSAFDASNQVLNESLSFANSDWETKTKEILIPAGLTWAAVYISAPNTTCLIDDLKFGTNKPVFPIDLQGAAPESKEISLQISKPANVNVATITMTVYDADLANEGKLTINNKGSISLFENDTSADAVVVTRTFSTPASWWNDGQNSLLFEHLATAGYRVDSLSVTFALVVSPVASLGQWGDLNTNWPLIPSSAANLPDGRILAWSSWGETAFGGAERNLSQGAIFDPIAGTFEEKDNVGHDMFCAGLAQLPNGNIFAAGGGSAARRRTSEFNIGNDSWDEKTLMIDNHWYSTAVAMPNGEVFVSYGISSGPIPEMRGSNNVWRRLAGINMASLQAAIVEWPNILLAPSGKLVYTGGTKDLYELDVTGIGSMTKRGTIDGQPNRRDINSVMYNEGKIIMLGGTSAGQATNRVVSIDVNDSANPQVTRLADMNYRRSHANVVLLPTEDIIVIGGNETGRRFNDDQSIMIPEIYNPSTNTWSDLAEMAKPRNYHSVALLLPDARVLSAGGGLCGNCSANHQDSQIYSPSYLFNADGSLADRPEIAAAPNVIGYGDTFNVTLMGEASNAISSFAMVKLSATTHSINTDLRRLELEFQATAANTYALSAESNENVMTPGYWMLFAINDDGVPSVAKTILIN